MRSSSDPASPFAGALADLRRAATSIELRPLAASDCVRLVELTTGVEPSARLVDLVCERSAGNPFMVKELCRLLDAQGQLALADRAPLASLAVPRSVRRLVGQRLAHLAPAVVDVLRHAAVLGPEFDRAVLTSVCGEPDAGLRDLLAEAVGAGVVEGPRGTRYRFAHGLLRDALYEDLPPSRRAALHGRVGEEILQRHADDLDAFVGQLAHHFLAAGDDRGRAYSTKAGARALSLLAYEEAVEHFVRALAVLPPGTDVDGERVELQLALGDAQLRAGAWSAAVEAYEQSAATARRRREPVELARAALGLGAGLGGFEVRLFDRRQLAGGDRRQFADWYSAAPLRYARWDERPTDFGAVVELESVLGQGNDELRFRELHLFEVADDLITTHTFYCTGPWDAETIARHAAEAPMVRW